MARVLVIGGSLLIGRALVAQLLERGDEVVIMHRGAQTPFGSRVSEIHCDRNNIAAVKSALAGQHFDYVFDNVFDWKSGTTPAQVNAAALGVASGLKRYVFTSSVAVYPPGGEYAEDAALVPSDYPNPYGALKAESERMLFALHRDHDFPVATIRPAFIYGPYNVFDREAFFWDRIVAGRPVIVPDDGLRTMQWVFSRDVARAAILAAETDVANGHAYNLANPPVTQIAFVQMLARAAGKDATFAPVSRERIAQLGGNAMVPPYYFGAYLDVPPITVSSERARADLGLELTPMEEGLKETFAWYSEQGRPTPDFSWEDSALAT